MAAKGVKKKKKKELLPAQLAHYVECTVRSGVSSFSQVRQTIHMHAVHNQPKF
jgi:hypothetical protein